MRRFRAGQIEEIINEAEEVLGVLADVADASSCSSVTVP